MEGARFLTGFKNLFFVGLASLMAGRLFADQLEPRAYWPAPVGVNVSGAAFYYMSGEATFDPSVPIKNVRATINFFAPFYGRTFGLFGRQAGIVLMTPFVKGTVKGDVADVARVAERQGPGDPALRLSFNLIGSAAMLPAEFSKRKPSTVLGTSLAVIAPFGEYDSSKLVNIGTNRWALKPELGLLQPFGKWELEVFTGVWLFTPNHDFYGGQKKEQAPLYSTQGHLIREIGRLGWVALDFNYYSGGTTTVNGKKNNDRQDNTRTGVTLAIPVAKQQWVKIAWSRGVSTRIGSDFDLIGATWQILWF